MRALMLRVPTDTQIARREGEQTRIFVRRTTPVHVAERSVQAMPDACGTAAVVLFTIHHSGPDRCS